MPAECQGPVSCPWGRKEWAGREEGKCCPPPCVAFRQALSGACIASNQAFAYKHISGQYAEEMLRGEDGGQGGAVNLAAQCKGPPPTVPSCLGQTRSIFSQSHPRIESWKSDVVLSLSCRCCYCQGLASRTSPFNCAPNSSIEPLPERLVVFMRSTRSAMDGSEVGCV